MPLSSVRGKSAVLFMASALTFNDNHDVTVLKTSLETDSKSLINWFHINKMKANPDKFQAIAIGKKANSLNLTFDLGGNSTRV